MGGYTYNDIFLGVLPFFHIYGLAVIMLLGLKAGSKIVTLPKFEPESFLTALQDNKVIYNILISLLFFPIIIYSARFLFSKF